MQAAPWTAVGAALLASSCSCGNECGGFYMRCDAGNVIEYCGGGVDQVIGRRYEVKPCLAPNPFCAGDGLEATCVASETPCDAGVGRCEGNVAVDCETRYVPARLVAQDCSAPVQFTDGNTLARSCAIDGARAVCR